LPENNKNGNNTSKSNNSENGSDDLLDLSSIDKLRKKYGVYEDEDSTEKISLAGGLPQERPCSEDFSGIQKHDNAVLQKESIDSADNAAAQTDGNKLNPAGAASAQSGNNAAVSPQAKTSRNKHYDAFPSFLHMPGFDSDDVSAESINDSSDLPEYPGAVQNTPIAGAYEISNQESEGTAFASEEMPLDPSFFTGKSKKTPDTSAFANTVPPISETNDLNNNNRGGKKPERMDDTSNQKNKGIGEIIRKIVLTVSIITMAVCIGILANTYIIQPYLSTRQTQKAVDDKPGTDTPKDWDTVKAKYPKINFPSGMQLDYAELYAQNTDFAGWLEIAGSGIDLPVVQGDNNKVYLKKTFYGEKSKYGCLFMDSNNNLKTLDRNTVIYGHNMSYDDLMFGKLEIYKKIDGFKAAPLIGFNTIYSNMKWKIYAVFLTNGVKSGDNGYVFNYIFKNLNSDEKFSSYINELDQRKLYTTGVDIKPTDKILTLSTCCYDFDEARLIVVARMVRSGESENVDTGAAAVNKNPRYPQAWYDANGKTNPYKNASKWIAD